MKKFKVPTGHICIIEGEDKKPLEFLSIGDYGKNHNLKADFLGLKDEINGVDAVDILPLEKKWVTTISTQYGCSMGCKFCDVPKVGSGTNASFNDLIDQVTQSLLLHPEVGRTERFNLHYARMGEPTWNPAVIQSAYYLKGMFEWRDQSGFHPVVSTMLPKGNKNLLAFLDEWLNYKNSFNGDAGLQFSINTTDSLLREKSMPSSMDICAISSLAQRLLINQNFNIKGRKITLNFALTDDPIDAKLLRSLFDPKYFLCKITPMHKTDACVNKGILTNDGYSHYYPYKQVEEDLKNEGFDVIVFIPSEDEDESKITCGNAILATGVNNYIIEV